MAPRNARNLLFPFVDPRCDYMQRSAVALIQKPTFSFALPELSYKAWPMLFNNLDRERLEFLGDALIGSAIAEVLFHCRPNEGPGFYTKARMVLTANSTFAHLMHKVGLFELGGDVKKAGDAFETIMAAFHHDFGPQAFQIYVRTFFFPLIESVGSAYDRYGPFRARNHQLYIQPCRRDRNRFLQIVRKQNPKHRMASQSPSKRTPLTCPVYIDLTAKNLICNGPQASSSKVVMEQVALAPDIVQAHTDANFKASEKLKTRAIPGTVSRAASSTWRQLPSRKQLSISLPPMPNYSGPTASDDLVSRFQHASLLGSSIDNPITID